VAAPLTNRTAPTSFRLAKSYPGCPTRKVVQPRRP
jgi:hypothetical protein